MFTLALAACSWIPTASVGIPDGADASDNEADAPQVALDRGILWPAGLNRLIETDTTTDDTEGPDDSGDTAADTADTIVASHYCYTLAPRGDGVLTLQEVNVDSGVMLEVERWQVPLTGSFHTGGLAWDGAALVFAGYNGNNFQWFQLERATGLLTAGESTGSVTVAWDGESYWTTTPGYQTARYSSFANLSAEIPDSSFWGGQYSRLAVDEGVVYGVWHSTDTLVRFDLEGNSLGTATLEQWDTWVWGVSHVDGMVFLIDDGRQFDYQRIAWFDAQSGALLGTIPMSTRAGSRASGLYCSGTRL